MSKLVSNNQGTETARLARNMGLSRGDYQRALTDGTIGTFLKGLMSTKLDYPDWIKEHLTPELEATEVCDPGPVELWLDPRQQSSSYPNGHEVYETLKQKDLLTRSISFGHLKWYEEHLEQIPTEFQGKLIWGWASVVRRSDGFRRVPYLGCRGVRPYVRWCNLVYRWHDNEPAGLRISA